jgi:ribosomal protein L40E
VQCPKCKAENPPGSTFCGKCGNRLTAPEIDCPKCGAKNSSTNEFCNVCGAQLSQPSTAGDATLLTIPVPQAGPPAPPPQQAGPPFQAPPPPQAGPPYQSTPPPSTPPPPQATSQPVVSPPPSQVTPAPEPPAAKGGGRRNLLLAAGVAGGTIVVLAVAVVLVFAFVIAPRQNPVVGVVTQATATPEEAAVVEEPTATPEEQAGGTTEPTPTKTPKQAKNLTPTTEAAPPPASSEPLNVGQSVTASGQTLTFTEAGVDIGALKLSAKFSFKNNSGQTVEVSLKSENLENLTDSGKQMNAEFSKGSLSVPDGGEETFYVYLTGQGSIMDYISVNNIIITMHQVGSIEVSKWRYVRQ